MMYVDNDDAAMIMHAVGGGFSPEAYSGAEDYWFYVAEELGVSEGWAAANYKTPRGSLQEDLAADANEAWSAKQGPPAGEEEWAEAEEEWARLPADTSTPWPRQEETQEAANHETWSAKQGPPADARPS
jgi:hypothetical protein